MRASGWTVSMTQLRTPMPGGRRSRPALIRVEQDRGGRARPSDAMASAPQQPDQPSADVTTAAPSQSTNRCATAEEAKRHEEKFNRTNCELGNSGDIFQRWCRSPTGWAWILAPKTSPPSTAHVTALIGTGTDPQVKESMLRIAEEYLRGRVASQIACFYASRRRPPLPPPVSQGAYIELLRIEVSFLKLGLTFSKSRDPPLCQ
jgi:hypothetical protein